jgi:three-Cys-motif partner protein
VKFGGRWTELKLEVVMEYLAAYVMVLKNQPFMRVYVDAFAGAGYRIEQSDQDLNADFWVGAELDAPAAQWLSGSALRALDVEPPFDEYIFIEKDEARAQSLRKLVLERKPELAGRVRVVRGDANEQVQRICGTSWAWNKRAVFLLDPFGLQVSWKTIAAIAATGKSDLWLLFPLSGVMRQLAKHGPTSPGKVARLDDLFGSGAWAECYKQAPQTDMFGEQGTVERDTSWEAVLELFKKRLESVFVAVSEPMILTNSRGAPLFGLFSAASNPKGAPIAMKLARHIMKKGNGN